MASKKRRNKGEEAAAGREKKRTRRGSSVAAQRPTKKGFLSTSSSSKAQPAARNAPSFGQGSGSKLKNTPTVYLKLVKHKINEKLHVLHTILYGKRTKAYTIKRNILQFSSFLWGEKKAEMSFKKIIEKCNKEILLDFCEILDIEHVKTSTKKEEITGKLVDLLESPCIIIDVIPAVKETKRRAKVKKMLDKCDKNILPQFCEILDIEYGKRSTIKEEISAKLIEILESYNVTSDVTPATKKVCTSETKGVSRRYPRRASSVTASEKVLSEDEFSRTKVSKRSSKDLRRASGVKGRMTYPSSPKIKKSTGRRTSTRVQAKDHSEGPSTSDLHAAICEIMKQIDINTTTFSDVLGQLGGHFNVDLEDRREEVRKLVTDVGCSMYPDEIDGSEEDEEDVGTDSANQEGDVDEDDEEDAGTDSAKQEDDGDVGTDSAEQEGDGDVGTDSAEQEGDGDEDDEEDVGTDSAEQEGDGDEDEDDEEEDVGADSAKQEGDGEEDDEEEDVGADSAKQEGDRVEDDEADAGTDSGKQEGDGDEDAEEDDVGKDSRK